MENKLTWLLIAILPASVWAQTSRTTYLDEMAKVDAQIAYVQKQTELREALKKSAGSEGLPKILSITVDDKGGTAQVVYGTGIVRWLRPGDLLQEGVRVQSIDRSSVVAGSNGSKFRLAFYAPPANAAAAATSDPLPAPPRLNIPLPQAPTVAPAAAAQPITPAAASTPLPAAK
ncbi:MAG: hypothetical protein HYS18_14715 [Burkholderiales bacterium]|nr:hypothetical protein [Burkholderiales bacterium]